MKQTKIFLQLYAHQIARVCFLVLFAFVAYNHIEESQPTLLWEIFIWVIAFFLWLFIAAQMEPLYTPIENEALNMTGAVTITFKLKNGGFGTEEERKNIHRLTDELDEFLTLNGTGEYDGDEFGNGECELYFFSDEPEKLFETIKPLLIKSTCINSATVEIEDVNGAVVKYEFGNEKA